MQGETTALPGTHRSLDVFELLVGLDREAHVVPVDRRHLDGDAEPLLLREVHRAARGRADLGLELSRALRRRRLLADRLGEALAGLLLDLRAADRVGTAAACEEKGDGSGGEKAVGAHGAT